LKINRANHQRIGLYFILNFEALCALLLAALFFAVIGRAKGPTRLPGV
jgi:hypothetical protein